MFAKHHRTLGALVISATLVAIGCADGQRQGNSNNKRMLRNPAFPGSTTQTPINQKVASPGQNGGAAGPNAKPTNTNDESQITARFDELTRDLPKNANPPEPTGSYTLKGVITHAQITTVSKGFVGALVESTYAQRALQPAKQPLSSGVLEQVVEPRTIIIPETLVFGANGVTGQTPMVLESTVEPKLTKPSILEQLTPVTDTARNSFALVDLLKNPGVAQTGADGKMAVLQVLPQQDGSLLLWISVEEQPQDAKGKSSTTFYRNFFFSYAKATGN